MGRRACKKGSQRGEEGRPACVAVQRGPSSRSHASQHGLPQPLPQAPERRPRAWSVANAYGSTYGLSRHSAAAADSMEGGGSSTVSWSDSPGLRASGRRQQGRDRARQGPAPTCVAAERRPLACERRPHQLGALRQPGRQRVRPVQVLRQRVRQGRSVVGRRHAWLLLRRRKHQHPAASKALSAGKRACCA